MFCRYDFSSYLCTRKTETGALVQLVRMPACHAGGHEFESRTHRKPVDTLLDWLFSYDNYRFLRKNLEVMLKTTIFAKNMDSI